MTQSANADEQLERKLNNSRDEFLPHNISNLLELGASGHLTADLRHVASNYYEYRLIKRMIDGRPPQQHQQREGATKSLGVPAQCDNNERLRECKRCKLVLKI